MLKYISWKLKRLNRLNQHKGKFGLFKFLYEKLQEKAKERVDSIERTKRESQYQKDFLELWQKNEMKPIGFRVLLLVVSFLDLDGVNFMQGGAERYTIELNRVINDLGGVLEVYQCGNSNWHQRFSNISIYGLNTSGYRHDNLNRAFHRWVPEGSLTIYYQMVLSTPLYHKQSICVSHGVDWDAHWLQNQPHEYQRTIQNVLTSIRNVARMVSVDTNTINWLRATDITLAEKCRYIPNFVDRQRFIPADHDQPEFIILYPRRLSEARGFWIATKNIPQLFEKYHELVFHFCGKAEPMEQAEVNHLCEAYPGRVKWFDVPQDQMPEVYQAADLVIIPTAYSEGTSLSCLEALASKRPVIASNVGGLPDLILSGYNGLLIEPNPDSFFRAVCQMMENAELRAQLAERGYETAQAFEISIWRQRWKEIIIEAIENPAG